jgi:hypothetical protein
MPRLWRKRVYRRGSMTSQFVIVPCNLKRANQAISAWHRHHSPIGDAIFCVAVATAEDMVVRGVAVVGRPASNGCEDGWTCEVRRTATDGTANACSKLLSTCRRVSSILGYGKIQTYTLPVEGGASLRAAGWIDEAQTHGRSDFSTRVEARPKGSKYGGRKVGRQARADRHRQQGVKTRWAVDDRDGIPTPTWPEISTPTHPGLFDHL